ncbi:hypothetical protein SAMN05421736_1247 [Evansella caseinilytica]|uniref:Uncharacterized protein n=1 Tax=Evansella caseinilytica TaxID=1503961 RepID=A0A1H3UQG9_9BACI|nr:hypothetical protein [Evansella caseinilytica]SDZ64135.1 hypothetical protein SAMN05421736_1247 [Evansella caseinilytica]
MHSFQAGCEWFSRNQDGDIPLLDLHVLHRVNLRRVTADAGREWYLSGIGGW